jgi:ABC-2 type transport system permease protein
MRPRAYALFMAAILASVFMSANMLAGIWLRGVRIDATAGHLYALSPGTRQTLAGLAEPIDLTFFYSAEAGAKYPAIRAYAARVREMLQSYAGRARGKLRLHEVEPVRFSESEDAANAAGIAPITPVAGAEPIYLGISGANAVDGRATLASLDPNREAYLEYDITRLIVELETPRTLNVAVISSLPLDPVAAGQPGPHQPLVFSELARGARIEVLARDFTAIPDDASLLLVVQPRPLSEEQLYAVDQFVLRKGRAFFAVDPAAIGWDDAPGITPSADLTALFSAWGVTLSSDALIDGQNALNVQTSDAFGRSTVAPQPLYFKIPPAQLARDDLITAALSRQINVAAPGGLTWSGKDGVTVTPLAATSSAVAHMPAAQALTRPDPRAVIGAYRPSGKPETIALRLSGVLPSAFAGRPGQLAKSAGTAQIVIVADSDFLNDGFYVGENGAPFADNAAFALNAVDMLAGSDALVSLRSRAPSRRPLTAIEAMQGAAGARLATTQTKLRQQLADAEQRLAALQERGGQPGPFRGDLGQELGAAEREAVDRFRAQAMQVRGELRAVERDFRRDIDQLEARVKFLDVWLIPLLLAGAALFVSWRRARLAGGGA